MRERRTAPTLEFLMTLAVDVGEMLSLGPAPRGEDVDPSAYFFRTIMRFETGAPYVEWLNKTIAVATAERKARQVLLTAYKLL